MVKRREIDLCAVEYCARFSLTIPSEAAKNARTVEMKWRSLSLSFCSQSFMSWQRSISSAVQKDASAFLYMAQTCVEINQCAGCIASMVLRSMRRFSTNVL